MPDIGVLGNAQGVHTHVSSAVTAGPAPYRDRGDVPAWFKHLSPPLRKLIVAQPLLISIGVLVSMVLWALRVPTTLVNNIVISLCIGNVLIAVMEYACRWYDNLNPPWNWVVYVPVLGAVSVLGTLLAAAAHYWMKVPSVSYTSVLREVAPFCMVVSMTVGTVWYGIASIQKHLQLRNQQLENALEAESDVVRKQEQELIRARQIQQDLLPKSIPQLHGIQVAGAWQPANAVSGDYYDVLALDDHRLAICIGDVVGKGITAALLMANLQAAFRAFATVDASPASVCGKLNAFMCGNVASGKFISFFYCIVDARDRSLAYENAGHCPAQLVRRSGEVASLCGEGAVLGVLPDWIYRNNRLQLENGDHLVLFTDGVTEAEDARGEEFGEDRVVRVLKEAPGRSAEDVRRAVMQTVTDYCDGQFRDDATVVVLAVQ